MYEPRLYRNGMGKGRFRSFRIAIAETDLWIGMNPDLPGEKEKQKLKKYITDLRRQLEEYIALYPAFLESHIPLNVLHSDPEFIRKMKLAGIASSTGPMAAVAGAFAMLAGKFLEQIFPCREFIIENGGDIFMKIEEEIRIQPFIKGQEVFHGLALKITAEEKYLSVCSSSGTFGHSFSYGKADLVTVISQDAMLADAWATSLANQIHIKEDVQRVTEVLPENIQAVLAVKDNKMGYKGPFLFEISAPN